MLKLFLLRHAQADGNYAAEDHERPLTEQGIGQARAVAKHFPAITLAICSSAKRTKMTLENVIDGGATIQKIIHSDDIYNGSTGDLLSAVQQCEAAENLLIIAHNPGIHQLVNMLAAENKTKERELLRFSYAPATLSVLECPIENWSEIKPDENNLAYFITPE